MKSSLRRLGTAFALLATAFAPDLYAAGNLADDAELVETRTEIPKLKAAAAYEAKNNTVDLEISEYAGYSGLIVANGGLAPNESSVFFKKHGFKLNITVSEEENWSSINSGRIGASVTTVDLLAAYGRQFEAVVPALIGFSRGADGVVVRSEIKNVNDLKGRIVAASQFNEADFFIRYLAQEAGLGVNALPDLSATPDPNMVNVIYCGDAFGAGDLFLRDLQAGRKRLAGCVTWAPKTTEIAEGSGGKAKVLISNRNLLIIADILVVNKGFAAKNPAIVAGLVQGLMEGNNRVRTAPDACLDTIGKAFNWNRDKTRAELAKVHLANVPEDIAFFSGALDSAGSFEYIYETARDVYGEALTGKPQDIARITDLAALKALEKDPQFADQKAAITPLRTRVGSAEQNPMDQDALLHRDIKFLFQPNSSKLESGKPENTKNLETIVQLLKVSPGSVVLLRGHADGSQIERFRREGGEARAREARMVLKNLSKARCGEIKQILQESYNVDASRIEAQGVGADEPTGKGSDADRRVEVQWYTLE